VLLQNCPNRLDFQKTLLKILNSWNVDDQLILYYSGHGEKRDGLFQLVFGSKQQTLLPINSVLLDLRSHGVRRAIIILDACRSGAALRSGEKTSRIHDIITADELPKGVAMIASCREHELSFELKDGHHSVFTKLFCEAISSGLTAAHQKSLCYSTPSLLEFGPTFQGIHFC